MKWIALEMSMIPYKNVRTVTVYDMGNMAGVYLIKRRDYKRNKVWCTKLPANITQ